MLRAAKASIVKLMLQSAKASIAKLTLKTAKASVAKLLCIALAIGLSQSALAQIAQQMIEVPTRADVTQRFLYLAPENPKASIILFSGGQGDLQIAADGSFKSGGRNFLVRNRRLFAENGLAVAVVDAPSDRQTPPFLGGFRQTAEHVADIKAVIGWLREKNNIPVWLVGTSRGTQSAAFIATKLSRREGGPDGLVLSSTILSDRTGRPVPAMPLPELAIPVLVVHHEKDGCRLCLYSEIPVLMNRLRDVPKTELLTITGGEDRGDPCEPMAHHGFNGQDAEVVPKIAGWITAK
jgi:pimeloyl-ACP methyl ester carboxylesterase